MKTLLAASVAAALFAGIATQIYALWPGNLVALLALCFAAALATAGVAVRVAARQTAPPAGAGAGERPARPPRAVHTPSSSDAEATTVAERETGTVKWFDRSKGYGFIIRRNADEIFVHHRSIRRSGSGRPALDDGQTVSFVAVERQRGWQAEDVVAE